MAKAGNIIKINNRIWESHFVSLNHKFIDEFDQVNY